MARPPKRNSSRTPHLHRTLAGWAAAAALAVPLVPAWGQATAAAAAPAPEVANSSLDAPLFYQLLIGEIELRNGQAGNAYEVLLDAARRTKDDALFRRAMEIALQGRAGDQALAATKAWRAARPESIDAIRYQIQLLMVLNRVAEVAEPLRTWLAATTVVERPGLIASLPGLLERAPDKAQAAQMLEGLLAPYRDAAGTRTSARVALGRVWAAAEQPAKALELARSASADEPAAPGPVLLALDLLPGTPAAEALVTQYLARPQAEPSLRLSYVRALARAQRYADAVGQLEIATRETPQNPAPWLTLGALRLELKQPKEAEAALRQFVTLAEKAPPPAASDTNDEDGDVAAGESAGRDRGLTQAWLLLSQAAEQSGDLKAAAAWLDKVDNPQRALEVQSRRASLLARQGQLREARELIRRVPERSAEDGRAKLLAEAQLLRDLKRWKDAAEVLAGANQRFPDDPELLYEQSMIEDKLERYGEMERLLRRVIALKPDHAHAHNALGYSLADRNIRLPEARALIAKALELTPGDPFITDSLGWVEFRMGNHAEALRLLRQAYATRPDTEIAAHLGEVLWAAGQRDEARRVWAEARGRDAANDVLRETLARLKVNL